MREGAIKWDEREESEMRERSGVREWAKERSERVG